MPSDILFYDFHPLVREFITRNKRKGYSHEDELVKYFVGLIKKANHNDSFSRKTFNSLITSYYLRNNLKIFRRIIDAHHSLKKRSEIINEIGLLLLKLGFEDEARQFHFECLELDNELQDRRRVVGDLRNIGLCYLRLDKNLALQYCIKALEEGKLIRYLDPMQYVEIGDIYISKNQYEDAFRYYNDGYYFALRRERKDLQLVYCIHAISIYYFHKHNYLKSFGFSKMALTYLESMMTTVEKGDYEECLYILLSNLSIVLRRLGKTELALENQLITINLHEKYHNVHGLLVDYHNLSNYYYELGRISEGDKFYEKYVKLRGELQHGIPMESGERLLVRF